MPPVWLGLSGRNSGKIPERPRKCSQSASWNSPQEYGWDPPSPIIQGIWRLQSISRILSPPVRLGTLLFFRSGSGEGLSELVMDFPAALGVFLIKIARFGGGAVHTSPPQPQRIARFWCTQMTRVRSSKRTSLRSPSRFTTRPFPLHFTTERISSIVRAIGVLVSQRGLEHLLDKKEIKSCNANTKSDRPKSNICSREKNHWTETLWGNRPVTELGSKSCSCVFLHPLRTQRRGLQITPGLWFVIGAGIWEADERRILIGRVRRFTEWPRPLQWSAR